jgi:hypothetical protein
MATLLKRSWWILLVRGIAAVLFGVLALVWPRLTVGTLILYFGAFTLVGGISDVIGSIVNRKEDEYWWLVLDDVPIGGEDRSENGIEVRRARFKRAATRTTLQVDDGVGFGCTVGVAEDGYT